MYVCVCVCVCVSVCARACVRAHVYMYIYNIMIESLVPGLKMQEKNFGIFQYVVKKTGRILKSL
jgi:hypothetical protein